MKTSFNRLRAARFYRLGFLALLWLLAAPAQAAMWGYLTNPTGIYRINTANGATSQVYSGTPFDGTTVVAALAQRPSDGQVFFMLTNVGNQPVYRWNPATPTVAPVLLGNTGAGVPYILRLTSRLSNNVNTVGDALYTINQTTGAATQIATISGWPEGTAGSGTSSGDIAFEPGTGRLLGATFSSTANTVQLFQIPLGGGAVTLIGNVSGMPTGNQAVTSLMIDANRRIYVGGTVNTNLYSFANTAGAATNVGNMGVTTQDFGTASAPSPTVTKSFSPNPIMPGAESTMTITVSNSFANPLTGAYVTDTYPSGLVNAASPAATNTCGGTLTATAGGSSLNLTGGTIPASSSCTITVRVRATTNGGFANTIAVGGAGGILSFNDTAATATLTAEAPSVTVLKTSAVVSDPLNGSTAPKRIPGSFVDYSITPTNSGLGTTDAGTLFLIDPVPTNTELFVGDITGVASTGPVNFTQGSTASGLTYTYGGLSAVGDDLSFSNDGGTSFTYVPVAGANGTDPAVTHIRVNPKSSFLPASGGNNPSFTVRFRVRVQ